MLYYLDPDNPVLASLVDFSRLGAETVYDSEDALVLRRGGIYYGAGCCDKSQDFCNSLMALCTDPYAAERLVKSEYFDDVTPVWQYVYYCNLPDEPSGDFTIRTLDKTHVQFLVDHYSHRSSTVKHMTERVNEGVMLGIFHGEVCMGFAGLHEEGAMGMLEILPEYRRRGLASALEQKLIRNLQLKGRIPYTHVFPSNNVSMALQEKLGFTRAPEKVIWLCKHDAYGDSRL